MLIWILVIVALAKAQVLKLQQVVGVFREECWILDTNNITAISMGNCQNSIYFVNIGLGTPPQYFDLQLDTSRQFPWLPTSSGFNYTESETFEITDQKTSTYIHENLCWGQVGSEIISVDQTNISIRNSMVWTSQDMALPNGIQGLLGMGYSNTPNFLDNAANQNQIQSSVFSLKIRSITQESILYYNQIPDDIWEDSYFVENTGQSTWQVSLNNFKIQQQDYSYIAPRHLIVDSTIDLIYFNDQLYNKVMKKYFKSCTNNYCPCDQSYPTFTFILDGIQVSVRSINYMNIREQGCFLLLGKTIYENSPLLVGTPLLKEYIVTFDKQNSRIGFTAQKLSMWPTVFLFIQFSLAIVMAIAAALGAWVVFKMQIPKKGHKSKSKSKSKKSKPFSISMAFIEPE